MTDNHERLLLMGELLIRKGLLSRERLEAALESQVGHRALRWPGKRLGDHLVLERVLTREALERALASRDRSPLPGEGPRLGEIAVRNGLLTGEDLDACLAEQEAAWKEGREVEPLGRLMRKRKVMKEQEIQAVLDRQRALIREPDSPKPPLSGD